MRRDVALPDVVEASLRFEPISPLIFVGRRAIRETWAAGLDTSGEPGAPGSVLRVVFVLGWPESGLTDHVRAQIAAENATHGDVVLLPCVENLHQGKTPHW